MSKAIRVAVALSIGVASTIPAVAFAGDIYVAANGSDANDGSSAQRPVATLAAAVRAAAARSARTGEDMTVQVAPGMYRGQTLMLDDKQMRGRLTIAGTSSKADSYPAFYGNGTGTFLRYDGSAGRDTGLTVRNLRIVDYATAITLNGNRNDARAFNRGTTISGNIFARIGTDTTKGLGKSTAAVRLVNSHDNVIENNWFKTIRNYPVTACAGLHAMYVAHGSSGNRIVGNTIEDFCGSAVKLRDSSDNNIIDRNTFRTTDRTSGIEEWFCDLGKSEECTKKSGECPSTGNLARGNRFDGIDQLRRVNIRGTRKPRPWCDAAIYDRARISANETTN